MDERQRDDSIGRLLRSRAAGDPPIASPGACLDADTLARWAEDALTGSERRAAEAHAASCDRCQSLLAAMVRTEHITAAVEAPRSWPPLRKWLTWLVPLTAATAAVALWVAVDRTDTGPFEDALSSRAGRDVALSLPQQEAPSSTEPGALARGRRVAAEAPKAVTSKEVRREAKQAEERQRLLARAEDASAKDMDERQVPQPVAQLPAAPPAESPPRADAVKPVSPLPTAAAAPAEALSESRAAAYRFAGGPLLIASPDPQVVWRVSGGVRVGRSTDGGATWEAQPVPVPAQVTAGSSPSASVCWLVGRSGMVLVTTDGRTWHRVPFPETVDLRDVRAEDGQVATVTTAGGRTFATRDGGQQWEPGR